MKSLQKTFDILEYVVLQNGLPVTPGEAAAGLGINPATCTRILGELVGRGYLVQVSRKTGYVPGPMVISLATRRNAYERLAAAARGPVAELSGKLRCQVNIAVLNRDRRIMLAYHFSDGETGAWKQFCFTDHWDTATGRLLIAALEDRDARKLLTRIGLKPFPKLQLEQIRTEGAVRFAHAGLTIIGHWIRIPEYPAAAFGFGVPPEKADEAFELSAATARLLKEKLSKPNPAY